ncbi:MAG: Co2+/Mg2+ efflux protein ApaG [Hyphomicrobiaceae bacterium]
MYTAVTRAIEVTVRPEYLAAKSAPASGRFVWSYTIEIANQGESAVQLRSRTWRITDANGVTEEVRGPGVVGEQPVILPGTSFTYTSFCPLKTPSGIMVGWYQMEDAQGELFNIDIPAFSLDSPFGVRKLN